MRLRAGLTGESAASGPYRDFGRGVGESSRERHVWLDAPLTGPFEVRPWFDMQGFPLGFGDALVLDFEPKALCSHSVQS